ncbi:hypothetical protein D3C78_1551440 [compost metagenome]
MLGRHVHNDQAIHARFQCLANETLHAITVDRVEVAHQHQRCLAVVFAELTNHLQGFRQVLLGAQGTNIRQLDRRAVGHRVGERHAQLDDIGTCRRQALEDRQRGVVVRVASRDESHQGGAVLFLEFGKTGLQAAHQCFSCFDCSC